MDTEALAKSPIGKTLTRTLAAAMESRFRYRFFGSLNILRGTGIRPGQTVLEVGCGTGYFTIPAAQLLGEQGCLVAMDILSDSVELVSHKVQQASLRNAHVIRGDALNTGLDAESFEAVLLLGVIPAPMLPLDKLLPEMHRILKVQGTLAVWPPIPGWLPGSVVQSGLFAFTGKQNGVSNFRRC